MIKLEGKDANDLIRIAEKHGTIVDADSGKYYFLPYWFHVEKNSEKVLMIPLTITEKVLELKEIIGDIRDGNIRL